MFITRYYRIIRNEFDSISWSGGLSVLTVSIIVVLFIVTIASLLVLCDAAILKGVIIALGL